MEMEEWSLEDDFKLIDAILHCGFDNWTDVASRLPNKSALECKTHYLDRFIDCPHNEELKNIVAESNKLRLQPSLCNSNCNLAVVHKENKSIIDFLNMEQQLRDDSSDQLNEFLKNGKNDSYGKDVKLVSLKRTKNLMSSISCNSYNPFRSEFETEYDDKAESVLELLCDPPESFPVTENDDSQLMEALKCALADGYNFRLAERVKRKKVIRNHALIDRRKVYNMVQRFDVPFGSSFLTSLFPFMKMTNGTNLDFLVEKLYYENELRHKMNSLIIYRSLGIRFLNGIHIYEKLNKKRLKYKKDIGYNGTPLIIEVLDSKNSRKPSAPLTLYNLPGFNLLEEDEKHLCSTARIVPETYYNFKKLLISECKKHGGLKLAQARQLLKIDVNKTRKMFDYLMSTGEIW